MSRVKFIYFEALSVKICAKYAAGLLFLRLEMTIFADEVQLKFMKSPFIKMPILVFGFVFMLFAVTSCGTSRNASGRGSAYTPVAKPEPPRHIDFSGRQMEPTVNLLLREADSWIGTAYQYGGNDRNGVDCSGFVTQVYGKLDIRLPRTSLQQQQFCTPLNRDQLQEGDLVFFTVRGGSSVGHVGIYIGNDQMIHASSSKGVIISSLSQAYYVTNYYGAGRIEPFYAMVDSERKRNNKKKTPVIAPPVVTPAEDPSVAEPVYAEVTRQENTAGQTPVVMKPVRIAHVPAAAQASVTVVQSEPVPQPEMQPKPESGLAELSEFFD